MISLRLCVMLLMFGVVFAPGPTHAPHATHNPHVQPTIGSGEVDAAIVNVNSHYDDRLCLELLLVDCATHVTKGDEQVCGSNGVTYDNHCHFTHAVCETLHFAGHQITLKSHGACPNTTTPPSNVATVTTDGDLMFNLFCSNVASITCTNELKIVCGSDSQFYPNMCVFTKERCKNRTLTISPDPNRC
ncbi:hypothetical protein DPMN_145130 [Dreissena polymorpha]|uniref:Kazal-like domain-containing protein n=1 Tax=Dreissena polymorpha TaxID=45954 RepID=A0A9D4F5D6_DREPO|nr:hypothetical protein DPMN_145130 [Dreissena polymorpha]